MPDIRSAAPKFFPKAKVALFGGSFDPPHAGHVRVAKAALRALKVDYVWWLVSPQNPLKQNAPDVAAARIKAVRALGDNSRFIVSAEEARLGTRYAIDTVRALKKQYAHVDFVWLIGADNLLQLHRWHKWRELMNTVPLAVYPRPRATHRAGLAPAAQAFDWARLPSRAAAVLADYRAPAWVMLEGAQSPLASSDLREG